MDAQAYIDEILAASPPLSDYQRTSLAELLKTVALSSVGEMTNAHT